MHLQLSKTVFWDVNFNELDEDKHSDFIIARIFQYGLLEDLKIVLQKFSDDQIKQALRAQRGLDKYTVDFAKAIGYLE
ncbi:MAG: hypothetical protein ABI763_10105 [Bacteroidota bacterium]